MSLNKAILIGRLGSEIEVATLESGKKVGNVSMATSKKIKDQNGQTIQDTQWHNLVFWGNLAEIMEKYTTKGSQVYVEGELRTRNWTSDGLTKYRTEIHVFNMKLLGGKNNTTQQSSEPQSEVYDDLPF